MKPLGGQIITDHWITSAHQTTGTSNLAYSIVSHPGTTIQVFCDAEDDVYEEEVRRDAEQLYPQRRTDLVVMVTAEKSGVKPYLMMPPTVYGKGLGLFKTQSIQLPFTIRHTTNTGLPEYIGDGRGQWDMSTSQISQPSTSCC